MKNIFCEGALLCILSDVVGYIGMASRVCTARNLLGKKK